MVKNYDGMINRKLVQACRWADAGNKKLAKERFDEAWGLMVEVGRENLKEETVTRVEWLLDNYYVPQRLRRLANAGYRAEGRILARQESYQEYYE